MRVQKSCPDRSEVNGWLLLLRQLSTPPPPAPSSPLTAVPTAMNSAMSDPNSFISTSSRTPTIPSAASASASASIRVIASSRAWYMACDSTSSSWFLPHRPTCSPARRRMASCGTPVAPRSTCVCSVMAVPPLSRSGPAPEAHPGHLPPLRVERENGETAGRGSHRRGRELRDRGADDRDFRDVVPDAFPGGALPLAHPHVNAGDHDPVRAHPAHIALKLDPGVMPGQVDQFGVAAHLGVPGAPERRAAGPPVIVPGPDRDPQRQADRHPSGVDELGKILAGQIGAERMRRGRCPHPPHG